MRLPFYTLDRLRALKEFVLLIGVPVLLIITIHANTIAARNAASTASLVKSQGVILQAIKSATEDGRLTAEQKSNLTICLLLVPQDERTPDVAANCRKQVEATTPVGSGSVSQTPQSSSHTNSASSSNTTPSTTNTQPNNSQLQGKTPPPDPKTSNVQKVENFVKRIVLDINPNN